MSKPPAGMGWGEYHDARAWIADGPPCPGDPDWPFDDDGNPHTPSGSQDSELRQHGAQRNHEHVNNDTRHLTAPLCVRNVYACKVT